MVKGGMSLDRCTYHRGIVPAIAPYGWIRQESWLACGLSKGGANYYSFDRLEGYCFVFSMLYGQVAAGGLRRRSAATRF